MFNAKFKRITSITLAICLVLATGALASVLGELINGHETFLGGGMELSKGVYWTGSDYRTENYIEYSQSSDVRPVVVSGSRLCNYGNFSSMAGLLEKQGKHVIAGINGDYYIMANYEPLGIVVQEGKLLSSDAGNYAVGFYEDGGAVFGKPALSLSVNLKGTSLGLTSINKTRVDGGMTLYTDFYSSATKNKGEGIDLVCSISGELTLNSSQTLTVEEIITTGGAVTIPQGKAVLSVSAKSAAETLALVNSIVVGDTITVNTSSPSEWSKVTYAIGSLYKLVTDGAVVSGLPAGAAPRTAIGKKADGSLVFYTMDGRQPGHSVGVSMTELAQRLIELGCVEATIMDGGGSTSLNAIYLGDSSASQINNPSDGYQRSVTNYIMLVTEEKPTGKADRLALYPLSTNIMSGANTTFTLKAADENGYAAMPQQYVELGVTGALGTISPDGTYIAAGEGSGTVTAASEGLVSAAVQVRVVKTPDVLRVFKQGTSKAVTSLSLGSGESVDLMAQAMDNYVYLISQDNCFNWSVEGNIGSISSDGVFTAGSETAQGNIVVKAGEKSVVIPVTVTRPGRYDDVSKGDWFFDAIEYVSEKGIMSGTATRTFSPDLSMSRAMVVTVLHRLEGAPKPDATDAVFSDVPQGQWYTDAVYWASQKGIVEGFGGMFDPNSPVTREQLAAILYRYKGSPAATGSLGAFSDAAAVSDWAKAAMSWTVEKGVIGGVTSSLLSPKTTATRAQVATILQRMAGI